MHFANSSNISGNNAISTYASKLHNLSNPPPSSPRYLVSMPYHRPSGIVRGQLHPHPIAAGKVSIIGSKCTSWRSCIEDATRKTCFNRRLHTLFTLNQWHKRHRVDTNRTSNRSCLWSTRRRGHRNTQFHNTHQLRLGQFMAGTWTETLQHKS